MLSERIDAEMKEQRAHKDKLRLARCGC